MGKDRAKTDAELFFEKARKMRKGPKTETKESKAKRAKKNLVKIKKLFKEKKFKGGLMVKPKAAKRGY